MIVGSATLSALGRQRRLLVGAVERHEEIALELDGTTEVMERMRKKALWRRCCYAGIVVLLLAAICLAWWLKYDVLATKPPPPPRPPSIRLTPPPSPPLPPSSRRSLASIARGR